MAYIVDVAKLSDEELIHERNKLNERLESEFFINSGLYDATATAIRELEGEMLRREKEGPPWLSDNAWAEGVAGSGGWGIDGDDAFDEVKGG